ncbi:MAG: hypothetical protein IKP65_01320 [Alphaproteobacteria bacterium]|nr:hypothetical protein [Alphaproteobacteria bacterium]
MNIKICNNCDKGCLIFIGKGIGRNIVTDSVNNRLLYISEKVFYHEPNHQWKCIKDRYKGFINYAQKENMFSEIEVDKSCPYYMEHQITEWNKEK